MKPFVLAGAIAACLVAGQAFGGAMYSTAVGYATEPTQILNHIELVAQYQKQIQQAETGLQSYMALQQQLRNLPGTVRGQLLGIQDSIGSGGYANLDAAQRMLTTLQRTQDVLPTIQNASQHAYATINALQAAGHGITTYQYELGMATLAQEHANTYGVQLQQYQQANATIRTNMQKMQSIAKAAPQITSTVGGMQALLQSNAVLGTQLASINTSLNRALILQTQQAKDTAQQQADGEAESKEQSGLQSDIIANRIFSLPAPATSGAPDASH